METLPRHSGCVQPRGTTGKKWLRIIVTTELWNHVDFRRIRRLNYSCIRYRSSKKVLACAGWHALAGIERGYDLK